jgi:hypothetical protein
LICRGVLTLGVDVLITEINVANKKIIVIEVELLKENW